MKDMCKTMFLHLVPVDGVEYFPGIFGLERYVFMFLCFQKTSPWTRPKTKNMLVNLRGREFLRCTIFLSSLGDKSSASSDMSRISSASFGILFFYCRKYDIPVPLQIEEFV